MSVEIPDSVTSIEDGTFAYCSSLTSVTIGNGIASIGSSAFYDCDNLTDVYYNDAFNEFARITVGSNNSDFTDAKINCADITTDKWGICGDNLMWSFYEATGTLTINGEGDMKDCYSYYSVPWYDNCSSIVSVVIENGVTSISNYAFYGCSSLTDVYYNGTLNEFAKIFVGSNNSYFTNTKIHCTDITADKWGICGDNLIWIIDDDGTLKIGDTGNMNNYGYSSSPFYNNSDIKTVIIEDGVTSIGSYAFSGCSGITSVTIPDSVTSIEDNAFYGCSALTNVYISDLTAYLNISGYSPMHYANKLYLNNKRITGEIIISEDVTSICGYAFNGCDGITSVTISDSVTSIGGSAFRGCSSLTSVTIPDSVISIGRYAFSGCSGLTSVTIPDSVTSISCC